MDLYGIPMFSVQQEVLFPSLMRDALLSNSGDCTERDSKPCMTTIEPAYTRVDAKEETRLEVEIPGVAKEDVSLELKDRRLVLKAKRYRSDRNGTNEPKSEQGGDEVEDKAEDDAKAKGEEQCAAECRKVVARYHLVMKLGPRLNTEAIRTEMCDGILMIRIAVAEAAKARSIEIGA